MSIFESRPALFDKWLMAEYRRRDDFTALVVLVSIEGTAIGLLRSTFMNAIGDDMRWREMRDLLDGSGVKWNGVAFFPVDSITGPVNNDLARSKLRELETALREDRRLLNEGHFFDRKGRRMKVEEVMH